jgi:YD repeat-containing protein
MATRKKKSEVLDMPGTMGSAKIVLPKEPTVVKGNHLTVTTHPDGRTELVWDDEALLKEVKDAILSVEQVKKPTVKTTRKKKVTND